MDDTRSHFERLYREAGPAVWAFARRQTRHAAAAEELLQETFVAAMQNPAAALGAASPRAWLLGIARKLVRNARRAEARRQMRDLHEEPIAPVAGEDDRLARMRQAINRLPDGAREVVELRLADELSYAEIATALRIPIGTVRSRLHHAMQRLRELLDASEERRATGAAPRSHAS